MQVDLKPLILPLQDKLLLNAGGDLNIALDKACLMILESRLDVMLYKLLKETT